MGHHFFDDLILILTLEWCSDFTEVALFELWVAFDELGRDFFFDLRIPNEESLDLLLVSRVSLMGSSLGFHCLDPTSCE
jgi:hypothetical protein